MKREDQSSTAATARELDDADAARVQERDLLRWFAPPSWMKVLDPEDRVDYDPYNTAAFRVKAKRPPRRSLDDMRKLDEEIRERRTTAKSGE